MQTVYITNGLFSAYVGETTDITSPAQFSNINWGNGDKYLEIQIETEILTPREKFTSVPYSFYSKISESSKIAEDIITNSVDSSRLITDENSLSKVSGNILFSKNNNIGVGTNNSLASLHIKGTVMMLGGWESKSFNTTYVAPSDGFIIGNIRRGVQDNTDGYATIETPVGVIRARVGNYSYEWADTVTYDSFICPIKKGDSWAVKLHGPDISGERLFWIPLGQ